MANLSKFDDVFDGEFLNRLNRMVEILGVQGKTIQDLVAEGQLTEEQYANLITTINGLIKSGEISKIDLSPEFQDELESRAQELKDKADTSYVTEYIEHYLGRDTPAEGRQKVQTDYLKEEMVLMDGTLDGWTPTGSVSTDGPIELDETTKEDGTSSLKFITYAGKNRSIGRQGSFDFSDYDHFRIWLRPTSLGHLSNFRITLNAPDTNNRFIVDGNYILEQLGIRGSGYATGVGLSKANFQKLGKPDWSNVTQILITVFAGDNSSTTLHIDNFKAQKSVTTKGKVILRFDDGIDTDYTQAFRLMKKKGLVGNSVIIGDLVGKATKMTKEEMQEMQTWGWDISSHSWYHENFSTFSYQKTYNELRATQQWLKDNGFYKGSRFHTFPYHGQNADTVKAANDLFHLNFSGAQGHDTLPLGDPENVRYVAGSRKTFAQLKKYVDDCVENKTLVNITFHGIKENHNPNAFEIELSEFEQFVDYLAAQDVDTITFSDLLDRTPIALR